jgi:hypothetical protein
MTVNGRDDRTSFVWYRHQSEIENLQHLTNVLAEKVLGELINEGGVLCQLRDGEAVPVGKQELAEIVNRHLCTPVVMQRDNGEKVKKELTFESFSWPLAGSKADRGAEPNDKVLIALRDALIPLVARSPVPSKRISARPD